MNHRNISTDMLSQGSCPNIINNSSSQFDLMAQSSNLSSIHQIVRDDRPPKIKGKSQKSTDNKDYQIGQQGQVQNADEVQNLIDQLDPRSLLSVVSESQEAEQVPPLIADIPENQLQQLLEPSSLIEDQIQVIPNNRIRNLDRNLAHQHSNIFQLQNREQSVTQIKQGSHPTNPASLAPPQEPSPSAVQQIQEAPVAPLPQPDIMQDMQQVPLQNIPPQSLPQPSQHQAQLYPHVPQLEQQFPFQAVYNQQQVPSYAQQAQPMNNVLLQGQQYPPSMQMIVDPQHFVVPTSQLPNVQMSAAPNQMMFYQAPAFVNQGQQQPMMMMQYYHQQPASMPQQWQYQPPQVQDQSAMYCQPLGAIAPGNQQNQSLQQAMPSVLIGQHQPNVAQSQPPVEGSIGQNPQISPANIIGASNPNSGQDPQVNMVQAEPSILNHQQIFEASENVPLWVKQMEQKSKKLHVKINKINADLAEIRRIAKENQDKHKNMLN